MINLSLEEGYVPDHWKTALVDSLLKNPGLDVTFQNFRPVSNSSFVSKVTERAVVKQLFKHCNDHAPLPMNQSAYCRFHLTETALLRVHSDILMSMDKQEVTLLILVDLSVAFDTIDHKIMWEILETDFGVVGDAQKWIKSFPSKRQQRILVKWESSEAFGLDCGLPQESCLGPVLFLLYASRLFQQTPSNISCLWDDTQLYFSFHPDSSAAQDDAVKGMEECITDVRAWLVSHRLMFSDMKTEFVIIGSHQQLSKVTIYSVKVGDSEIKPIESVRNFGAWFDKRMTINVQVGKICSKSFRGLYNIRQIRKFLSTKTTKTLVNAFVTSHLDHCNSLLFGLLQCQLDHLQKILNAAARVICLKPKFDHITPVLVQLHWLPVKFRIEFKIVLFVYKALHGMVPPYLAELLQGKPKTRYQLRSGKNDLLFVPPSSRKTFGDRAFAHAGPTLWNSLPLTLRLQPTVESFKNHLKTYLFKKAFNRYL